MPLGLLGAAVLFWGWFADSMLLAAPIAALLEVAPRARVRLALDAAALKRLALASHGAAALLFVWLGAGVGVNHALIELLERLPACFAILVVPHRFADSRASLWRLFVGPRAPPREVRSGDPAYPYWALCLVAAAVANDRSLAFYLALAALAAWALWPVRARGGRPATWVALFALAAGLGWLGQLGLRTTQLALEAELMGLVSAGGSRTDPSRSVTDLGHLGALKQSDRIVMRVRMDGLRPPLLLHRASYDRYLAPAGQSPRWYARGAPFEALTIDRDGAWPLAGGGGAAPATSVSIVEGTRFQTNPLALPSGVRSVRVPGAAGLRRNRLGTVEAQSGTGYLDYVASGPGATPGEPPGNGDLELPVEEAAALSAIAAALLADLPGAATDLPSAPDRVPDRVPDQALDDAAARIAAVQAYFRDGFRYATYRGDAPRGAVISDFLTETRRGHCEYFATAAALLLRALGVPTRYATGFSVQERSGLEGSFVVRERHAHAWVRAWADGAWRDVDTTPPAWFAEEAAEASRLEGLRDLAAWARYRLARASWDTAAVSPLALTAAGVLLAWIGWRARGRIHRGRRESTRRSSHGPRPPSALDPVLAALAARGLVRPPHAPLAGWLETLEPGQDGASLDRPALRELVAFHYRQRFAPGGLGPEEQSAFSDAAARWLRAHERVPSGA